MSRTTTENLVDLIDQMSAAYQAAAGERGQLHRIEWDAPDGDPSILGEAEVYADIVAGLASQATRRSGPRNRAEVVGKLAVASLFSNPILTEFVLNRDREYPVFCKYLLWVESLRSACLWTLSAAKGGELTKIDEPTE